MTKLLWLHLVAIIREAPLSKNTCLFAGTYSDANAYVYADKDADAEADS